MLDFLRLAHPPLGPQPVRAPRLSMRVPITGRTALPLPVVAYDLPWATVDTERAALVADTLDELGLAVAALRCELGYGASVSPATSPLASSQISHHFCPYRPDRYGLQIEDLTMAKVVDIRLAGRRDPDGRFAHSAEQVHRWDLRHGRKQSPNKLNASSIPAILWPPDVSSLEKLAGKVAQLRELAPSAAICLSIGIDTLEAGLPAALRSAVDLLAVRADDWPPSEGAQLAARIAQTRRWLDSNQGDAVRLLIVPPPVAGPADCVKMLALGADLIAVDGWCGSVLERQPVPAEEAWAVATLGVSTRPQADRIPEVDTAVLHRRIEQMVALMESAGVASVTELGPHHLTAIGHKISGIRMA